MKRILLILAIASFASCNNSAENDKKDPIDSIEDRKDSLNKMTDTAFERRKDSLDQKQEAIKDKNDSLAEVRKDSVKKADKKQ